MTNNSQNDRIYKGLSVKWITVAVLFVAAAIIVIIERGFETGLYVATAAAMFVVLLRVFLELLHFVVSRSPLGKIWALLVLVTAVYGTVMLFLGMGKTILFLVVLSLAIAAGIVLIERILVLFHK